MDQANEKKIEAINALSEGDKLFLVHIQGHEVWFSF